MFHFGFWAPVMFLFLYISAFRCRFTTRDICIHEEAGRRRALNVGAGRWKLSIMVLNIFAFAQWIGFILSFQKIHH